jgi:signal transduction histidine kinase
MFFADLVFPVFTTPYVFVLFMPWLIPLALIAEGIIFKLFYRDLGWVKNSTTVLGANAASWFLGIGIGGLLPMGIYQDQVTHAEDFNKTFLVLAFVLALIISVIVESGIWWTTRRELRTARLFWATAAANVASYSVVIGLAWLFTR